MAKQIETHPDLSIEDYKKLPDIIARGEIYQQGELKLIYLWDDGTLYRAAVKTTADGRENYLVSLFKMSDKNADRDVREKFEKIR